MALGDKQIANVSAFAATVLEPGEQIVAVLGQALKGPSVMIVALISTWLMFLQKPFAIVVTDRRVLLIRLKMSLTGYPPKDLEVAYPRASVKATFTHGPITGKLVVQMPDREPLSLSIQRPYIPGAGQVASALT
jgi:hypothetical protein